MNILSFNVNGLRAIHRKNQFFPLIDQGYDILCFQETKAFLDQLPSEIVDIPGYHLTFHEGKIPGYAGTAVYTKQNIFRDCQTRFSFPHFHEEGRVTTVELTNMFVVNVYFPNGGDRKGQEMLTFKLSFFDDIIHYTQQLRSIKPVILVGDMNICHQEIDIARPKENENSIGFLPIERKKIQEVLDSGFTDALRHFHPEQKDMYTWWSPRGGARARNVGWRIDAFYVDNALVSQLQNIEHHTTYTGSDHCPISLLVKEGR